MLWVNGYLRLPYILRLPIVAFFRAFPSFFSFVLASLHQTQCVCDCGGTIDIDLNKISDFVMFLQYRTNYILHNI